MSWPMLPSRAISGSMALHQQGFGLISVSHVTTKGHSSYLVWADAWGHIDVQGLCRSASLRFSQWLLHSEEQAPPLSWAAWESWGLAVAQVNPHRLLGHTPLLPKAGRRAGPRAEEMAPATTLERAGLHLARSTHWSWTWWRRYG